MNYARIAYLYAITQEIVIQKMKISDNNNGKAEIDMLGKAVERQNAGFPYKF